MIRRFFTKVKYIEQPCDIVFVNGYGNVVITGLKDIDSVSRRPGYSPYGVVVLPSWHHRYNDGSMGIMSLEKIREYADCDLLADSYFTSMVMNTRYVKDGITVDRMSGYWMDANGLPGMQPNNIFYSWVSNKNYCHRGRFMCRWSRNLGFINMLNNTYKNIRQ